jgi:hypothetical protein
MCEDKPLIGFLVWEGDRIPAGWIETLADKRVTQVWVPSCHTYQAITYTISCIEKETKTTRHDLRNIKDKIKVIPHGVDTNIFYPMEKKND